LSAPSESLFKTGDLVAGIVRRPDPVPCESCAAGEWDMCKNGRYTERGIKERDGFCSERYRIEPEFAIRVDASLGDLGVLVEPASVVAKAWQQIERIGQRAFFKPRSVLITGAGPIGLLAALMARQRGLEVHVVDKTESGLKPELVKALGATYSTSLDPAQRFDIALECTGVGTLALDLMSFAGPDSVICLTGVSSGGREISIDIGSLNRSLVLENAVVFGTVNARRTHYETAAKSLLNADKDWLSRLITRRVPLERWGEALAKSPQDVKIVVVPK
jgi:threonine dehydrogenase-like Zn-dependent dehydrogenase